MLSAEKRYRYEDETDNIFRLQPKSTAPIWPGFNSKALFPFLPMLITEIYQLTPYIGDNYIRFHPRNMRGYRIGKIGILGIVTSKKITAKQISYMVDDGTARIKIVMNRNAQNTVPRVPNKPEGELNIPRSRKRPGYRHPCPLDVHQIRQALTLTNESKIQQYDHVVAWGYCDMEIERKLKKPACQMTEKDLKYTKIFLRGTTIRAISQTTCTRDLITLIIDHVQKRIKGYAPEPRPRPIAKPKG